MTNELIKLAQERSIQLIVSSIFSLLTCQFIKMIIFSIRKKSFDWRSFFTTGGMPSSHTACVTTLTTLLGIFEMHDNGGLGYPFAVAFIFSTIIIHDAMGVRLEASKHARILNNMVEEESKETKRALGFGKNGKLKELLGHRGYEVVGGFIVGLLFAFVTAMIFI